jgi:hypothetical protein
MLSARRLVWLSCCALPLACGGGSSSSADESMASFTLDGPSTSVSESMSPMSTDTSTTDPSTTDPSTTDPSTTDPSTTDPSTGPKFDTITESDLGMQGCGGGMGGDLEFSYIWIANSPQGTVSKIDTQTLTELARYQVRPQGGGDPSRTSVNLQGDMVVGARLGGVAKFWARPEDCVDDNGTPGLQTSSGKNDILAFDQEECRAWYTDYNFASERAVAWTSGEFNQGTCKWENAKVWIGATNDQVNLEILRLNGDTGVEEDHIQIPGTAGFMSRSPYGAAVDADNNLWTVNGYCGASLVTVSNADLSYELIPLPQEVCAYGITVDSQGFVWIGGYQQYTGRYDPVMQTWDLVQAQGLGIQEDGLGRLWLGAYGQNGVYAIDGDTLQVLSYTAVPTTGQSKGVAVDFFGYIWVVSDAGNAAVRLDPDTLDIQIYNGLDSPYSYSDMTGWGLKNTTGDPQG